MRGAEAVEALGEDASTALMSFFTDVLPACRPARHVAVSRI